MKIPFTKMHGLGNDFVLVDGRDVRIDPPERFARSICARRFGVGADQLLVLMPARAQGATVRMDIYNSDGSRVEMCGNGVRAFAQFAAARGFADPLVVETDGGLVTPKRLADGQVEVDMGEPVMGGSVEEERDLAGGTWTITTVSIGNPHCVIFTSSIANVALEMVGPQIETDPFFPNRTNVEFVEVRAPDHLAVRVWERGAGATLACGSGACAALVAAAHTGKAVRSAEVRLPGGLLRVEWREDGHVYQTGPATHVFDGEYQWPSVVA